MEINIRIDLTSLEVTVQVINDEVLTTEAPAVPQVEDEEQKTLADFHIEHYDLAAAVADLDLVRRARAGDDGGPRDPHHCQRCQRAHRQRSSLRNWRCRSCEFEENWDE